MLSSWSASLDLTVDERVVLLEFREARLSRVLLKGDGLVKFDRPVDAQFRRLEGEATIGLGIVVVVNLVEEVDIVGQRQEAVGKATRYQELTVVAGGEDVAFPLLVGWGALPHVNDHVEDRPGDDPDQLDLGGLTTLEVEPTQYAGPAGQGLVVLDEVEVDSGLLEVPVGVGFLEEAPVIAEDLWRDDLNILQFRVLYH